MSEANEELTEELAEEPTETKPAPAKAKRPRLTAAIRYYSRGGNVEAMAEALARGTGVEAISVDAEGAELTEPVDLLFIGGALYAWKLDPILVDYLKDLDPEMVGTAIVFGSSALFRRPILLIQDLLKEKGIKVNMQAVYARNHPNANLLAAIEYFGKNEMVRDRSLDGLPPWLIAKRGREMREAREAGEDLEDFEDEELLEEELSEEEARLAEAEAAAEAAEAAAEEAAAKAEAARKAAEEALAAAEAAAVEAEEKAAAVAAVRDEATPED